MRKAVATTFELLEAIKFSHSIFAMPFAVIALLLARRGEWPSALEWLWIAAAMVGARTWAMSVNRLADAKIDSRNPRTAARAVASGRIRPWIMAAFGLGGGGVFCVAAGQLSPLALGLALPVLAVLAFYSYTKRFSFLCHVWLGLCLGLAPLGAWVALRGEWPWPLWELFVGIVGWVGGFDVLYALQDMDFDRREGLHSIPARFGLRRSLWIARLLHLVAALAFWRFGLKFELGALYFVALGAAGVLMAGEHWLLRKGDLSKLNVAFFNLNGWVATVLLLGTALAL